MPSPPDSPPVHRVSDTVSRWWHRLEPVHSRVASRLTVDTRSLAVLRIALGCILLGDLLHRAQDIAFFYTDGGVYPVSAYQATYERFNGLSVHALSGDLWVQQLLFVVAGLFAVAFVLGYRTRLVGLVSFLLLFSLHARNPLVLNGGDRLIRVLLLVALTAPLGERWSIDAARRGSARERVLSFGSVVVLAQPLVIFTCNALMKHRGDHWYAGEAIQIALSNDVMTILLGNVIVEYPLVMTVLNYIWITLLGGSVLFLLLTDGRVRALAALTYMGVFAGMAVTMAVGLFPFGLMASVTPYLTTPFWEWVGGRVPDRWAARVPSRAQLGPLGKPPVERRLLDVLRSRGFEDVASGTVTAAKVTMGAIGFVVLVWMLVFAADDVTVYEPPDSIERPHVDQQWWGLYAPDPSDSYSWYVVETELEDGTSVDALDWGPVSFAHPPEAAHNYDTFRHRKYMQQVESSGDPGYSDVVAAAYIGWVCDEAAQRLDSPPRQVTVYQMYQQSPVHGPREPPERQTVMTQNCDVDYLARLTRPRDTEREALDPEERKQMVPDDGAAVPANGTV